MIVCVRCALLVYVTHGKPKVKVNNFTIRWQFFPSFVSFLVYGVLLLLGSARLPITDSPTMIVVIEWAHWTRVEYCSVQCSVGCLCRRSFQRSLIYRASFIRDTIVVVVVFVLTECDNTIIINFCYSEIASIATLVFYFVRLECCYFHWKI